MEAHSQFQYFQNLLSTSFWKFSHFLHQHFTTFNKENITEHQNFSELSLKDLPEEVVAVFTYSTSRKELHIYLFRDRVWLCSRGWLQICNLPYSARPPKCWDYRYVPQHLAYLFILSKKLISLSYIFILIKEGGIKEIKFYIKFLLINWILTKYWSCKIFWPYNNCKLSQERYMYISLLLIFLFFKKNWYIAMQFNHLKWNDSMAFSTAQVGAPITWF
jgi:hypothetical protein